jgi:F-type H+-transporting ATPase subunit alpha
MAVEDQVAIIYLGTKGLLRDVPVNMVRKFEAEFLEYMNAKHRDTLDALKAGKYTDTETSVLEKVAADMTARYKK